MTWRLVTALLAAAPPLDGRGHPVQDDVLDQLAGTWKLTGTVAGRQVRMHAATARPLSPPAQTPGKRRLPTRRRSTAGAPAASPPAGASCASLRPASLCSVSCLLLPAAAVCWIGEGGVKRYRPRSAAHQLARTTRLGSTPVTRGVQDEPLPSQDSSAAAAMPGAQALRQRRCVLISPPRSLGRGPSRRAFRVRGTRRDRCLRALPFERIRGNLRWC
jgi:hypothetical protein